MTSCPRDAAVDDRLRTPAAGGPGRRAAGRGRAARARRALSPPVAAPGDVQDPAGALLGEHGIAYETRRGLGTPPDLRFLYRAGRLAEATDGFRRHLDAAAGDEVAALAAELPGAPPTALLCLEADPAHCHRRVVAEALARRRGDLEVIDL